jgi:DNA-binding transcriptional MerR regulator
MEEQKPLLIGELAKRAGVTARTIRYYASEGLLPPPTTRGRYAYYGPEHLRRLELIARLKADYLPLSAIRQRLETLSEGEAQRLLSPSQDPQSRSHADWPRAHGGASKLAEHGASYELPGADPFRLAPALPMGRVEFFPKSGGEAEMPDEQEGPAAVTPELWRHYALAPGVELRIRESLPPRRRRQVVGLLTALRDKLLSEEE